MNSAAKIWIGAISIVVLCPIAILGLIGFIYVGSHVCMPGRRNAWKAPTVLRLRMFVSTQ